MRNYGMKISRYKRYCYLLGKRVLEETLPVKEFVEWYSLSCELDKCKYKVKHKNCVVLEE